MYVCAAGTARRKRVERKGLSAAEGGEKWKKGKREEREVREVLGGG